MDLALAIDADLDQIVDLYYYEDVPEGSPFVAGGAGAYAYRGSPEATPLKDTPLEPWVDDLARHVAEAHPRAAQRDFRVSFRGRDFRATRHPQQHGTQACLRVLPTTTPSLDTLRLAEPMIRKVLAHDWLSDGGLVLFCGLTGMGKTTLASATITARLEAFGGRCVGVEDVLEMPLEGLWGKGSCRQLEVDYDDPGSVSHGFGGAIRAAYRSFPATRPAILYVGEVRDTETATEVVKAASNGMLVISTIHALDATTAIQRLVTLARTTMDDAAHDAVAQALRLVVYQQLRLDTTAAGWERGAISGHMLISDGAAHPVANLVRQKQFQGLAGVQSYQDKQVEIASRHGLGVAQLLKNVAYRQE